MQPPPPPELLDCFATALAQLSTAYVRPQNIEVLQEVARLVNIGDFYKALMKLHPLIAYEAELLQMPTHEWRRSKPPEPPAAKPYRAPERELAAAD
jgi:flagellar biosynthesis regulator FlbT